ncbi:MAG: hypothetical protein D6690_11680 [Nitrospirae bacterium]|nr:MAG: hypothetical protein D6690_11680 [Nitrospirota bacterium]
MRRDIIAGLETVITGGPDREGGGDGPLVVLLHGFGAPGDDLVPLWRMLDVPESVRFVFPSGPLRLSMGMGDSRAWWMLDMDRLIRERTSGNWMTLIKEVPEGLGAAREQVARFVAELEHRLAVAPQHMLLGGFSQGAILACDLVLRSEQPFAGMILLSGTIIAYDEWMSRIPARRGMPVFQSHGTDDPILAYEVAQQLREAFRAGGLEVEWHEFRGGHEIPLLVLERLGLFIRRVFSGASPT